ncbi:MFS transporter [Methylovirgula sp. 4M-Z18]|uniref:MFS transporter n=1 Tax=Methylovirgula sp. 4M-Z18 TaxID=2293567 RepID=UPI000E2EA9B7|nr:MFS transporter [Methylovirgula sp. 4M-Z18]RFB79003.1 MFS transporter [Methylovirgula sp. 4M-Z18]
MSELEKSTMSKVTWRLVPFLMVCYFIAYLDRVNISFAGDSLIKDLDLTKAAFGGAAGIFFIAYFFFEVPSNLALDRFGARLWIARIMFTWGLVTGAQAFVTGIVSLNVVRFLLGVAEAGFFPGIIFFLTLWFPAAYRARIVGMFMVAIPVSTVFGAPLSSLILYLDGVAALHGWQWMFLLEALPALLMAFAVYFYLTDRPHAANWLSPEESRWLQGQLDAERANRERHGAMSWLRSMCDPRVVALGFVYMGCNIPQYGLSFFLPQIVKAFGDLTKFQVGCITALPYAVGALGMIYWGWRSDRHAERKWHAIIPLGAIVLGLGLAAMMEMPTAKMACLCIAGFGFFAVLPVFWTLPTTFLTGTGAAAGIAAVNSIGNLGGFFGPQVFGWLKDKTGQDAASLSFLAACAVVGAVIVFVLGHNPTLERPAAKQTA